MEVSFQARFSPALMEYASRGCFAPYPEKTQAGLNIIDSRGQSIYQSLNPRRVYDSFEAVPSLIVQSLLFIENRELLDTARICT